MRGTDNGCIEHPPIGGPLCRIRYPFEPLEEVSFASRSALGFEPFRWEYATGEQPTGFARVPRWGWGAARSLVRIAGPFYTLDAEYASGCSGQASPGLKPYAQAPKPTKGLYPDFGWRFNLAYQPGRRLGEASPPTGTPRLRLEVSFDSAPYRLRVASATWNSMQRNWLLVMGRSPMVNCCYLKIKSRRMASNLARPAKRRQKGGKKA